MPGHSTSAMALGALMLWFGWYGFNIAPAYGRGGSGADRAALAARAAVNTTLSACAAGLAALATHWAAVSPTLDLRAASNGVLGGIVAATAICAFVDPWAGAAVGAAAGAATVAASAGLAAAGLDDPLDSVAVHAAPAVVGLLAAALLARPDLLASLNGVDVPVCGGLAYARGRAGWSQLGVQVAGAAAIAALSASASAATFGALRAAGRLRVDTASEVAGIDHVDHGGPAYPDFELRTRGVV
jgi:Amt family ammonium transporter